MPSTSTKSMHNIKEDAPYQSELIHFSVDKPRSSSSLHSLAVPTVTPLLHNIDAPSPPKLKLTLSAYHRSENTVRLTDACLTKLIHSEYELLDPSCCHTLGHGASSTVRLAFHRRTGKAVAVKTIAKHNALGLWNKNRHRDGFSRTQMPRLEEVDVLTCLRGCDNVIQLLDVYETNTEVQLVLEYCEGGDLFDCIKKRRQRRLLGPSLEMGHAGDFMEREASRVAKTLLGVLKTLHDMHIVHRDVKPENILLSLPDESDTSLDVKLADFGLARLLRRDTDDICSSDTSQSNVSSDQVPAKSNQRMRAYSCVGSNFYTAPEVNTGLGYDTPVDIYSLGVTIYVMLCGTPPSISQFNHSLYKMEDECRTSAVNYYSSSDSDSVPSSPTAKTDLFPPEFNVSPLAQDFILNLIHPNPKRRITASDALKHKWITCYADEKVSVCDASSVVPITKKRSISIEEAEALLKLPIQGSLYEIAPPVLPPANSPKLSPMPTPPPVSLTLARVCSKLVPLLDEQRHHSSKNRSHKASHRKHSRGTKKKANFVAPLSTPMKKVRVDQPVKDVNSPSSCNMLRIVGQS